MKGWTFDMHKAPEPWEGTLFPLVCTEESHFVYDTQFNSWYCYDWDSAHWVASSIDLVPGKFKAELLLLL